MLSRPSDSAASSSFQPSLPEEIIIARKLKTPLTRLIEEMKHLTPLSARSDPTLATLSASIKELYEASKQAATIDAQGALKENLKDAGEILQNILTQPLQVSGLSDHVTLLAAAHNYKLGLSENSELSKILFSCLQYPEPTQILLRELQLLDEEITI